MRLIDADALLWRMEKRHEDLCTEYGSRDTYSLGFEEGMVAVEDADTIEAVPVQESDGCEFCVNAKWISGEITATHPVEDGFIVAQMDGDFEFCPMCGRRLL